jgi:hypothetical protein
MRITRDSRCQQKSGITYGLIVCCRDTRKGGYSELKKRNVLYSCVKDEGRPLGIGFQEQVSNHSKLLRPKDVVVSVGGKIREYFDQVSVRETNASEPFEDAS